MKQIYILLWSILLAQSTFAQGNYATNDTTYKVLVEEALNLMNQGKCQPCLEQYEAAFVISQRSILSRLRAAACAFACNNDKWMYHIETAIDQNWSSTENILKDAEKRYPELFKHNNTVFFRHTLQRIEVKKIATGYDALLAAELEIIRSDDQALRQRMGNTESEIEKQAIWDQIHVLDSINVVKIEQIIAKHGYPGKNKVGENLASTAFLVIQHADLPIQEKYYPLLEQATNTGDLSKSSFALLVDRIRMRKGQPQLYGSQVVDTNGDGLWEFHPIEDEANVNKRRAEMGLGTIEEYAQHFNIEYKPK